METSDFLAKLQDEAALQARLNSQRLLPKQLDPLTSLIGNYTWQVLLVVSLISAVLVESYGLFGTG